MVDNTARSAIEEETAEEIVELYKILGLILNKKSARGRRVGVNEVQNNNGMASQLTKLTRKVALLNNRAQPSNEVCGLCGVFGHGANMCTQNVYEPEQLNYMNAN